MFCRLPLTFSRRQTESSRKGRRFKDRSRRSRLPAGRGAALGLAQDTSLDGRMQDANMRVDKWCRKMTPWHHAARATPLPNLMSDLRAADPCRYRVGRFRGFGEQARRTRQHRRADERIGPSGAFERTAGRPAQAHPDPRMRKGSVESARDFLTAAGVTPASQGCEC
jgi:hypothetical protein